MCPQASAGALAPGRDSSVQSIAPPSRTANRGLSGTVLVVLSMVLVPAIWGYNWVVMKRAMVFMSPFEFATWRYIPAALILFGFLRLSGRTIEVRPFLPVILSGVLQTGVNAALGLWALRLGAAGTCALLTFTMPLWVTVLAWPFLGERPTRYQIVAIAAAVTGMVLVLTASSGSSDNLASVALATSSGISWAAGTVLTRWLLVRRRVDPMALTAWQMLFGGLAVLGLSLCVPGRPAQWNPYLVFAVIWEVLPATAFAWLLWNLLLRRLSASLAALTILLAPVIALASSCLELGERPKGMQAAGMAFIAAALALAGPLAVRHVRRSSRRSGESPKAVGSGSCSRGLQRVTRLPCHELPLHSH